MNFCNEAKTRAEVYYRHKKRGSKYLYVDEFELDWPYVEGDCFYYITPLTEVEVSIQRSTEYRGPVVIYMDIENYKLYARPKIEFFDGRFEKVK